MSARHDSLRAWIDGSAIVDERGDPLVLYHGTNQDFDAFDRAASREEDGIVFATPNPRVASDFALYRSVWPGAQVMPLYARARSVLVIEGGGRLIRDVERDARVDGMRYGQTLREYALEQGYDAICFRDVVDPVGPDIAPRDDVYALLPAARIKSALGNSGSFDPASDSLTDRFGDEAEADECVERERVRA